MTDIVTCPSFVRAEIENWIAWCWQGESPEPREPRRCYSAEGAYRIRDGNSEEAPPPPRKPIIHAATAERVQAIFDRMSQMTRRVLQYEYTHRSRYDQWERDMELHDGELRPVWVRVSNNRRQRARIDLKIGRDEYMHRLVEFWQEVLAEFESEVCA